METIIFNVDGHEIKTEKGKNVLEAALDAGIFIPHLCYHPDLTPFGSCRLCIVEIEGMKGLPTSCTTPAVEGMVVKTKTPLIDRIRRLAMELIFATHPADCMTCPKYLNCQLQSLKQYIGVDDVPRFRRRPKSIPVNNNNPLFVHDFNRCILCGRCVRACYDLRGIGVLSFINKSKEIHIGTVFNQLLNDAGCKFCGACIDVCPTGALRDKEELTNGKTWRAARVPCTYSCPAEIDIPRYIRFIRNKNYSAAVAVIREKAPFPRILGYVCDHPCEMVCRRGEVNEALAIKDLKRFAAEKDDGSWKKNIMKTGPTGKKIAIVGSGPAGLSAAYYLSKFGHTVDVFESLPFPGGMMRVGIPEYRLPKEVLDAEIKEIEWLGINIKTDTRVDSLDTLLEQGYHAILVAIGAHEGQKLSIPGSELEGVLIGSKFLRDFHLGRQTRIGKKVMVLGGGNVAIDCARVVRRLGGNEVRIACLESRDKMRATQDEIKQCEEEGIIIYPSQTFIKILGESEHVIGVECLDVESFEFDEEGRPLISAVEGTEHILTAETIIIAIGQYPQIPPEFDLAIDSRNTIKVDSDILATSKDAVFAAGDAVTGTTSVVEAIAGGRKGAISIDKYLGGNGIIDEKLAPIEESIPLLGREINFAHKHRPEIAHRPVAERLDNFDEVMCSMDERNALEESQRCLQCDLRLEIKPPKFWGDY